MTSNFFARGIPLSLFAAPVFQQSGSGLAARCPFRRLLPRGKATKFTGRYAGPLLLFLSLVIVLSIDVIGLRLANAPSVTVMAAAASAVSSNQFVCDGATHAVRVNHTTPVFTVEGPSSLTVSANRCTYQKGLNITIPSSAPPPGMNPLVRILIYGSTFLSTNTKNPALLIQSTSNATSQHYRLEVVIANSTIRAEQTTGSGDVYALHFYSISFRQAKMTVFGCRITASTTAAHAHGIVFTSSLITNSTVQLLSSTVDTFSMDGNANSVDLVRSPLTDAHVNISGSLLNATSDQSWSFGLSISNSPLLRSNLRLFSARIVSHSSGNVGPTFGIFFSTSALTHSNFSMYGGSVSSTSLKSATFGVNLVSASHVSNSVFSFHGTSLSAFSGGTVFFGCSLLTFTDSNVTASAVDIMGGSITVVNRGSSAGLIIRVTSSPLAGGSVIRTNGTALTCEGNTDGCVLLDVTSPVADSLFGFYGGSLVFSGATASRIWKVQGTKAIVTDTSFVLSRCDAQLKGGASTLYLADNATISFGTTLYWHYSSYAVNGGPRQQLLSAYTCDGTPCPNLSVLINDASTPLMPSTCPHCLAPYGAAVSFDDGSGHDYSVPSDSIRTTATAALSEHYTAVTASSSSPSLSLAAAGYFTESFTDTVSSTCSITTATTSNASRSSIGPSREENNNNNNETEVTTKTKSRSRGRRRPPRGKGVPFEDYPFAFKSNHRRNP